ncbi:MAG: lysophospholipid acyltransferase family protein [Acidobacteriota bacterium]|nr:lysophospholipid acyltransferase family protein [Acidobacteriota bacterium]
MSTTSEMTRSDRIKVAAAAAILALWVRLVGRSCRLSGGAGEEHLEGVIADGGPVILCMWHNRLFYLTYYLWQRLLLKGVVVHPLISRSKDGELLNRLALRFGYSVVRGSTSRGGATGLRQLARVIRHGGSVATVGDGPRGPRYVLKPGPVSLAKLTGAPILPIAYASEKAWAVNSWDRLVLPKPFSNVAVVVGQPVAVARNASDEDLSHSLIHLQKAMDATVRKAEEMVSAGAARKPSDT